LLTTLKSFNASTIDFLVNNAGIGISAPFDSLTEDQFDELLNVHFKGVYFLTQKLLPHITDGGAIVNLSTGLARFSNPGYSAYASMKGAVDVLTRYMARELGSRRIRANVVAPGAIDTDFTKPTFDSRPEIRDHVATQTALGRVGTEEARWINGQRIEVSGGIHL
jgi:NAD(P)-dependent dehydrogenase (short-subunit alcohol dehydrogenase family)